MRRKLRTALSLSWSDWWDLTQAWTLLLVVDAALRVLSFRRVQGLLDLGRRDVGVEPLAGAAATIRRLGWVVEVAACNHLYPMTCLRRSLVLRRLLGRHGIVVDLRIGVHRKGSELDAHAWLEYQGQPIGESQATAAGYMPLVTLGPD